MRPLGSGEESRIQPHKSRSRGVFDSLCAPELHPSPSSESLGPLVPSRGVPASPHAAHLGGLVRPRSRLGYKPISLAAPQDSHILARSDRGGAASPPLPAYSPVLGLRLE